MLHGLTGWHLVILIGLVVILFGAPRLPGLARSVGESLRIFRREVKTLGDESKEDDAPAAAEAASTAPARAE